LALIFLNTKKSAKRKEKVFGFCFIAQIKILTRRTILLYPKSHHESFQKF
jgi:hypothetical protein